MDKMIEIKNLNYSYTDNEGNVTVEALKNVSLEINKGDFVGIIGRNGSGKSTLAKLLNGILIPHEGEIIIDGMNTKDTDKIWEIRQKAGMIFQNPDNQMVATIVEEDVAFGPENLGIDPKEIRNRVDNSLLSVQMSEFKDKKPHELSGGQKQRIAIAGILAMEPECIILDEPTAMLDPKGRIEVINTIKELNKKGTTVILITHYMEEVVDADKVFILDRGEKVFEGTPREVFSKGDKLKELMLEPPYATKIAFELKKKGKISNDKILTLDELVEEICQ
ncbi:energy-coupling factor transporter ATPase [Anaerofustis sp.]|uniref:energy-coupling factor transporter ATPase n=1 Tax=Anaerofustis sp. TaxID=1872517 RepID=UPI0025BA3B80|nr:energy-coupling factor transporter ATPase [Anaerofustis sp.]